MPLLWFGLIAVGTVLGIEGCNTAVQTVAQNLTAPTTAGTITPGTTLANAAGVSLKVAGVGTATAAILYVWLKNA